MIACLQAEGYGIVPPTKEESTENLSSSQEKIPIEEQHGPLPISPPAPNVKHEESKQDDGSYSQQGKSERQQEEKPRMVTQLAPVSSAPPTRQEKPERPVREKPPQRLEHNPTIVMGERAQIVLDTWNSTPWMHGIPLKVTEAVAEQCSTLAACDQLPTREQMMEARHRHKKEHPEHKGYKLGNFVTDYRQLLEEQYEAEQAQKEAEQAKTERPVIGKSGFRIAYHDPSVKLVVLPPKRPQRRYLGERKSTVSQ
jgi:hypothetical protein